VWRPSSLCQPTTNTTLSFLNMTFSTKSTAKSTTRAESTRATAKPRNAVRAPKPSQKKAGNAARKPAQVGPKAPAPRGQARPGAGAGAALPRRAGPRAPRLSPAELAEHHRLMAEERDRAGVIAHAYPESDGEEHAPLAFAQHVESTSKSRRVRHSEIFHTVRSDEEGIPVKLFGNAGLVEFNPWLSVEARAYEQYEYKAACIKWIPVGPATRAGSITMSWDPDSNDAPLSTTVDLMQRETSVLGSLWAPTEMDLPCRATSRFVRNAAQTFEDSARQLYDFGALTFLVNGLTADTTGVLGYLEIHYDVVFTAPAAISEAVTDSPILLSGETGLFGVITNPAEMATQWMGAETLAPGGKVYFPREDPSGATVMSSTFSRGHMPIATEFLKGTATTTAVPYVKYTCLASGVYNFRQTSVSWGAYTGPTAGDAWLSNQLPLTLYHPRVGYSPGQGDYPWETAPAFAEENLVSTMDYSQALTTAHNYDVTGTGVYRPVDNLSATRRAELVKAGFTDEHFGALATIGAVAMVLGEVLMMAPRVIDLVGRLIKIHASVTSQSTRIEPDTATYRAVLASLPAEVRAAVVNGRHRLPCTSSAVTDTITLTPPFVSTPTGEPDEYRGSREARGEPPSIDSNGAGAAAASAAGSQGAATVPAGSYPHC